jgi:hypothetical protein
MAGEYQKAQQVLDDAMASVAAESGMQEETFSRALMAQLLKYYQENGRTSADVISELEQHIRSIQDGGQSVVTRGS